MLPITLETIPKSLRKKIEELPGTPGVYLYKDAREEIIYVGKANSLHSRVRSYFRADSQRDNKTALLVSHITDLEYLVVTSEIEALLLENNLIKKHRPRYNIRMRDDKNYQYVKITKEAFPEVLLVRGMRKDGAKYYGPYTGGSAIKYTLRLVEKIFPYRKCKHPFIQAERVRRGESTDAVRRCADGQIGRCIGCDPKYSQADHDGVIKQVKFFFDGHVNEIEADFEAKMLAASEAFEFELAAEYRDRIQQLQHIRAKQQAVMTDVEDRDVLGATIMGQKACVQLLKVRQGLLIGREEFTFDSGADADIAEVVRRTLVDYYEKASDIPPEILVPAPLEEIVPLSVWLKGLRTEQRGQNAALELAVPARGDKKQIVDLAVQNAKARLDELIGAWMTGEQRRTKALRDVQEALDLPTKPVRIECYDISHMGGEGTVASMVVFQNGEPKKSDYRKFKLQGVSGGDDYAAMNEIFNRRFQHLGDALMSFSDLKLRRATPKDLPEIIRIITGNGLDQTDVDPALTVVAKRDKAIVGLVRLRAHGVGESAVFDLASLWVDGAARGAKLGYTLIGEVLKRTKARAIYAVPHAELAGYYEGFGFIRIQTAPEPILEKQKTVCRAAETVLMKFDKLSRAKEDLSFKSVPDLLLIDGGKGQLAAGYDVMKARGLVREAAAQPPAKGEGRGAREAPALQAAIGKGRGAKKSASKTVKRPKHWRDYAFPIASLAKDQEEVFVPWASEPIALPADTLGSLLLQAARDEAHRFALNYQRKLRTKTAMGEA